MLKREATTLVQRLAGAPAGTQVPVTVVELVIQMVADELWKEILDLSSYRLVQRDTLTSFTAPGYFATTSLSKRLYKIQHIERVGVEYTELHPRYVAFENDAVVGSSVNTHRRYVYIGNQIHLLPYETSGDVEVQYSYMPTLFTATADATALEWPDGSESAFIDEAVARLNASEQNLARALSSRQSMRASVRRTTGPIMPYHKDLPEDYGSE